MRGGFFFRLAFSCVRRSVRSSAVLGFMVFSATACLVFLSSLAVGTNDAMIRNSVGLFSGSVSADGIPPDVDMDRLRTEGVRAMLIRQKCRARLSRGDRADYVLLFGIDPEKEKRFTALWKKKVAGDDLQGGEAGLFLSEPISTKLNARVGDAVGVLAGRGSPEKLVVRGIYRSGVSALDQGIAFVPSAAMPCEPDALSAALFLEEGADAIKVAERLRSVAKNTFEVEAWPEFMPDLKQLIDLNFVSMGIVMALVFGIVSIGISCAFVIFILKNLREYGVMKAMGVFASESTLFLFFQVAILTVFASLAGSAAGAAATAVFSRIGIDLTAFTSQNRYFAVSGIIYPRLTVYSLCLPPVLAFLFGMLGAIWPSIHLARERAAEILRRA